MDKIKSNDSENIEAEFIDIGRIVQQYSEEELKIKKQSALIKLQEYFRNQKCKCNQVLDVDDNKFNIVVFKQQLLQYGVNIDEAEDGKVALDLVTEKARSQNVCCQHYKLIIMDTEMPVMNGFESAKAILDFYKDKFENVKPPIICCKCIFNMQEEEDSAKKAGMNLMVPRPLMDKDIFMMLEYSILKQ